MDQFEPGYRTLVVACKSDKRWFDLDAVRTEPVVPKDVHDRWTANAVPEQITGSRGDDGARHSSGGHAAGAPPLDYWLLDTQDGVDRVLKSMLPEKVCRVCGEPSRRIVEQDADAAAENVRRRNGRTKDGRSDPVGGTDSQWSTVSFVAVANSTLGWTDCNHNDWRAGVVLDPFDLTTKEPEVGQARYIIGDVFEALESLPDNSVDLVFSSPPFLALRSYLPADHPNKSKEIGSEATPADFLDTLLDVVEACDRVLAPHGSLCFELGDTFAGSGTGGGDAQVDSIGDIVSRKKLESAELNELPTSAGARMRANPDAWPLPKSLCGIPTLFAWSLAYGRNLLRPERVLRGTDPCAGCSGSAESWAHGGLCEYCDGTGKAPTRWRIRNVVVWARPNPPVGALGDKFRPATSYLTVACKSDKRWFDLDAVREVNHPERMDRTDSGEGYWFRDPTHGGDSSGLNPAGAPPLDYWEIPTHPYKNSHYATFPPALCVKPIASMCPSKVCRVCGEPSRRIVETEREVSGTPDRNKGPDAVATIGIGGAFANRGVTERLTLGWTDCNHNDWRAGVVCDPFAGSGTTLSVATGHGRDAIGIDLDSRNAELALERVGPLFLTVETLADTEPFAPPAEDVETDAV